MTTPTNGYVPAQFLADLVGSTPRVKAEKNTAAAYARLHAAHPASRISGLAAGYWSRAVDEDLRKHPAKYDIIDSGLSPVSHSPHGLGTRINIHGVTPAQAAAYGFREYNSYTFDYTGELSWNQAPPKPVDASARTTVAKGANVRSTPDASSPRNIVTVLKGSTSYHVDGYRTDGVAPYHLWFRVAGAWASASAFTSDSTAHLVNQTPATKPPVTTPPVVTPPATDPPTSEEPPVDTPDPETAPAPLTEAELAAYAAELPEPVYGAPDASTGPLTGLLANSPKARKRAYYAYAGAALVLSFGPDVVVAGVLTSGSVPVFVAVVDLSTSILLKIGVAFGFVAASNVSK